MTKHAPDLTADVAIVGGGLSGLTLATALATAGISVICLDRESADIQLAEQYDGRTTAIALGSKRVLDGAGVWSYLSVEAEPIQDIRVADQHSPLYVHYDHRDVGDEPFGWIVENRHIRKGLLKRVTELPALQHITRAEVTRIERTPYNATLMLDDGRSVQARLVVGADGKKSFCRENAGIKTIGWSYDQTAIVCTMAHEKPHHGIALEHFLPSGPFAVLPMTDNRSSIVWTERSDRAPLFLNLPEERFNHELRQRTGEWLGEVRAVGPKFAYPLSLQHANSYIAERLALVGEAAHAIHPIAGQGLNMGLRDVAALAEVVVDAHRLGIDVGSAEVLDRFQRWRRTDNALLAATTDAINRLFSNSIAPVRLIRDVGLALVERTPPLKRFFMRHAMGTVGDLPRLIRGEPLV